MKRDSRPHGHDRPPVGWPVQLFLEGSGSAPYAGVITGYAPERTAAEATRPKAIIFGHPRNGGEGFTCWGLTHGHVYPSELQWWEYVPSLEYTETTS